MSHSTAQHLNTLRTTYQKEDGLIKGKEIKCVYYLMHPNRDPQNKLLFFRKICQLANSEDEKIPLPLNNKTKRKDKLRIELNNYSLPFHKNFNYNYNFCGRYKPLNVDKEPYNYMLPNTFTNITTNNLNSTSNLMTFDWTGKQKSDLFPTALDLTKVKKETDSCNYANYKNDETSTNRLPLSKKIIYSMMTPKVSNIETVTYIDNCSSTNRSRNFGKSEKIVGVSVQSGKRSNSCFKPNNYVIQLKKNYFQKPFITHEKQEFLKPKDESAEIKISDYINKQRCNEYNLSRMFDLRKKERYVSKNDFLKFKNKLQKNMKF